MEANLKAERKFSIQHSKFIDFIRTDLSQSQHTLQLKRQQTIKISLLLMAIIRLHVRGIVLNLNEKVLIIILIDLISEEILLNPIMIWILIVEIFAV